MIFLNNITQIHKGYSYNKTQKSWKIAGKLWELLIEYEKNNNEIKINTIIYKEYIEDGSLYQCAQIGGYYNWDGYVYEQLKKYEIYFDNEYKNIIKLSKSFLFNYNKTVIKKRKGLSLKILEEYSYKILRKVIKELDELFKNEEL